MPFPEIHNDTLVEEQEQSMWRPREIHDTHVILDVDRQQLHLAEELENLDGSS